VHEVPNRNTDADFSKDNGLNMVDIRKKQKLQDKLDNVYITTGRPYQGDLWELSDYATQWMKGEMDCSFPKEKTSIVD
jgi:hypothetical protein